MADSSGTERITVRVFCTVCGKTYDTDFQAPYYGQICSHKCCQALREFKTEMMKKAAAKLLSRNPDPAKR